MNEKLLFKTFSQNRTELSLQDTNLCKKKAGHLFISAQITVYCTERQK